MLASKPLVEDEPELAVSSGLEAQEVEPQRTMAGTAADTAEAPPAAATFLQPRADLKAAPGKERKAERFPTARNSATNTSPSFSPLPPPVFNVANGNPRKAS